MTFLKPHLCMHIYLIKHILSKLFYACSKNLKSGETITEKITMHAKRSGKREVIASFQSNEMQATGAKDITVKHKRH